MKKSTVFFALIITVSLLFSSCTFANKAGRDTPQIKDEWMKYADGNSECAQTYKTLIAFFTKDTAALASAAGIKKDLLKSFDSIKFSSYDIPDTGGIAPLSVSFTVSESECEAFPCGDYDYVIKSFGAAVHEDFPFWERRNEDLADADADCTKLADSVCRYMLSCTYGESGYESLRAEYDGVIYSIIKADMTMTGSCSLSADNINKKARELFGISDFNVTDEQMSTYRGKAEMQSLLLPNVYYEIEDIHVNGDTIKYDVRFFGDCMGLTVSHIVAYTFEKADNDYGYRLQSAEVTVRGALQPGFYVLT